MCDCLNSSSGPSSCSFATHPVSPTLVEYLAEALIETRVVSMTPYAALQKKYPSIRKFCFITSYEYPRDTLLEVGGSDMDDYMIPHVINAKNIPLFNDVLHKGSYLPCSPRVTVTTEGLYAMLNYTMRYSSPEEILYVYLASPSVLPKESLSPKGSRNRISKAILLVFCANLIVYMHHQWLYLNLMDPSPLPMATKPLSAAGDELMTALTLLVFRSFLTFTAVPLNSVFRNIKKVTFAYLDTYAQCTALTSITEGSVLSSMYTMNPKFCLLMPSSGGSSCDTYRAWMHSNALDITQESAFKSVFPPSSGGGSEFVGIVDTLSNNGLVGIAYQTTLGKAKANDTEITVTFKGGYINVAMCSYYRNNPILFAISANCVQELRTYIVENRVIYSTLAKALT